jgi:predicted RNA binding protein YcfA (HicA-like mRNA interferase family)
MSLPVKSGKDVVKTFYKVGLTPVKQDARHVIFHNKSCRHFNVPLHQELKRGTLMGIIAYAGLTKDEFIKNDP